MISMDIVSSDNIRHLQCIYTFAQYLCLECESSISTKVDGDDGDPTQSDHDDSGPKLVAFIKSTFITQSIDQISI
jgi:hypothetical protein